MCATLVNYISTSLVISFTSWTQWGQALTRWKYGWCPAFRVIDLREESVFENQRERFRSIDRTSKLKNRYKIYLNCAVLRSDLYLFPSLQEASFYYLIWSKISFHNMVLSIGPEKLLGPERGLSFRSQVAILGDFVVAPLWEGCCSFGFVSFPENGCLIPGSCPECFHGLHSVRFIRMHRPVRGRENIVRFPVSSTLVVACFCNCGATIISGERPWNLGTLPLVPLAGFTSKNACFF